MHVVVHHRITDPEKFFSMDSQEVVGNAPSGVKGIQFYPSKDQSSAFCLWESESIEAFRDYLDSATGDASENTYFEVNSERAMGLPEAASASA